MDDSVNMSKLQIDEYLAAIWRCAQLFLHRYQLGLTGELLMAMTILILDREGRPPNVVELASVLDLPKSTVSRYIGNHIDAGYLEEVVDPQDRRRRLLQPTEAGRQEFEWFIQQLADASESAGDARSDLFSSRAVSFSAND